MEKVHKDVCHTSFVRERLQFSYTLAYVPSIMMCKLCELEIALKVPTENIHTKYDGFFCSVWKNDEFYSAGKVHMSEQAATLLAEKYPEFRTEPRGEVIIKASARLLYN